MRGYVRVSAGTHRVQKKALGPLEQELWAVVSSLM